MAWTTFLLSLLAASAAASATASASPSSSCRAEHDVCIVGAGGSGTYAAVALKQRGYSVLVLEKTNRVGGHCHTWVDPVSGYHIDTGVHFYSAGPIVTETFTKFNVTLTQYNPAVPEQYGNITIHNPNVLVSGNGSAAYLGPAPSTEPTAFINALTLWLRVFAERWSYIDTPNGAYPDFSKLHKPTLRMLESPFGELLDSLEAEFGKGCFDALLPLWYGLLNIGPGSLRETDTLNVLRNLKPIIMNIFLGQGYTVAGGCSNIYNAFHAYLGNDVKLNVEPFTIQRPRNTFAKSPIKVSYTQDGNRTVRTTCRRLIVSALQSLDNLNTFMPDLDETETAVFKQVTYSVISNNVIRVVVPPNTLPSGVTVVGLSNSILPSTVGLSLYGTLPLGLTWVNSLTPSLTAEQAADLQYANLTQWSAESGGAFLIPANKSDLTVYPGLHHWQPRVADVNQTVPFVRSLYRLQGHRNTYYTGALLSHGNQYDVWRYSDWLVNNTDWTC